MNGQKNMKLWCFLILLVVTIATSSIAIAGGYPSPEEAVLAYYDALFSLDAEALIATTQLGEDCVNAITDETFSKAQREYPNVGRRDDYISRLINYRETIRKVFADPSKYFRNGDMSAFDILIIDIEAVDESNVEWFRQYKLVHDFSDVRIVNFDLVKKSTGEREHSGEGTVELNGKWYVYDGLNWHYYVNN